MVVTVMSGGLLQLVAYGAQDIYLTGLYEPTLEPCDCWYETFLRTGNTSFLSVALATQDFSHIFHAWQFQQQVLDFLRLYVQVWKGRNVLVGSLPVEIVGVILAEMRVVFRPKLMEHPETLECALRSALARARDRIKARHPSRSMILLGRAMTILGLRTAGSG